MGIEKAKPQLDEANKQRSLKSTEKAKPKTKLNYAFAYRNFPNYRKRQVSSIPKHTKLNNNYSNYSNYIISIIIIINKNINP